MEQETKDFREQQKLLEDELAKYKDSPQEYKPYMQFMDDISAMLNEVGK